MLRFLTKKPKKSPQLSRRSITSVPIWNNLLNKLKQGKGRANVAVFCFFTFDKQTNTTEGL